MQITHRDSGYDWQKCNEKFCMPKMTYKVMTKIEYVNSEKRFFESEKMASRNIFRHFVREIFFIFVLALLRSNHTLFLVQFEINLRLWVFQKSWNYTRKGARAISAFWNTHSCKSIPNSTRNRMITFTNSSILELHL